MFNKDSFEVIKGNLIKTNRNWKYFTNHEKVMREFERFEQLVVGIGKVNKADFIKKFIEITSSNRELIEITPLLSAVRTTKLLVLDDSQEEKIFDFKSMNPQECISFLEEIGFFNLFNNGPIDLPSYYLGVEVGLDSNGRKNRGGKLMENFVCDKLKESKWNAGEQWMSQVKSRKISELFNVDFQVNIIKNKQFDFVIVSESDIYVIETNFFNSGGSKINSMLGRFKEIGAKCSRDYFSSTHNIHFIWITDGEKLTDDLGGFEEAYNNIEIIMNIENLENGSLNELD
ncbi:DpnII family type II restriction endonuclease [Mycoplasma marinum]|nr:DpnII family type II restriction endonuclease [Mycoplasma marinum]